LTATRWKVYLIDIGVHNIVIFGLLLIW